MHRLIADSGGWTEPNRDLLAYRGQLGKRKQYLEMQAGNLARAISEGRALTTLLPALEKIENELTALRAQMDATIEEIAASTVKRPTAADVQGWWRDILDLWQDVNEAERVELLSRIVVNVSVVTQNKASMLLKTAGGQAQKFVTTSNMGAHPALIATNPRTQDLPIFIPTGGLHRLRKPRPLRRIAV